MTAPRIEAEQQKIDEIRAQWTRLNQNGQTQLLLAQGRARLATVRLVEAGEGEGIGLNLNWQQSESKQFLYARNSQFNSTRSYATSDPLHGSCRWSLSFVHDGLFELRAYRGRWEDILQMTRKEFSLLDVALELA